MSRVRAPGAWANFAWTPSGIAGIGFEPGTAPATGSYVPDLSQTYVPGETTNEVFVPSTDAGNYDVGDFSGDYSASSNLFFDVAGDGRQHRTAWAELRCGHTLLLLTQKTILWKKSDKVPWKLDSSEATTSAPC